MSRRSGEAAIPDYRATGFSATIAVLVAAAAGLALGVADGNLWGVLAGVVGGAIAALGVRAVQAETNDRRAVGSVGVVVGTAMLAGVALGGGVVALLVGVGVAAAAINATVSLDSGVERPAIRVVWRSATTLGVGAVLAAGIASGAFLTATRYFVGGFVDVATANDLARLITLQVEVLLITELAHWAIPILDQWLPENRDLRAATLNHLDVRVEDVPRAYWVAFGLQLVVALTPWGPDWFEAFLGSLSVFGDAIRVVLRSGVLHGLLAGLVLALVGVLVARILQGLFVSWAGTDPPRSLASAAGGIATLAVAAVVSVSPLAGDLVAAAGPTWGETIQSVGPTASLAAVVAATLFGVLVAQRILAVAVGPWVAAESASGFAVAGGALFVAALLAADRGGSALAVFAGVAGALVVHDLGSNAVELGRQVGDEAETRAGEAAHAVGSLLVGAAGVALATVTAFVMGSVTVSLPAWRARLAVALLLVAVLCFAVLFERG